MSRNPKQTKKKTHLRVARTAVRPLPKRAPRAATKPARARPNRWPTLTARDIMRRNVVTVDRTTPLSEVERVLVDAKISGAPVTDEAGQIVGVVSLRDLVERYVEDPDARPRRGRGFFHLSSEELLDEDYDSADIPEESEETAIDVMTAEVYRVDESAPLAEIAKTMVKHRIHRVLVESRGHFAGILGTFEVLGALTR